MTLATPQLLVGELSGSICEQLTEKLKAGHLQIGQLLEANQSPLRKFEKLGTEYFLAVIASYYATQSRTNKPETKDEITNKVIEWLSREVSTEVSKNIVEYTIGQVKEVHPLGSPKITEEEVKSRLEASWPLMKEGIEFRVRYDGKEVKKLDLSVEVEAKMRVKNLTLDIESVPELRIDSLDLRGAEVELEFTGPMDRTLARFTVPISGKINL